MRMLSDAAWGRWAGIHPWTNGLSTGLLNRLLLIGKRSRNIATAVSETFQCETYFVNIGAGTPCPEAERLRCELKRAAGSVIDVAGLTHGRRR